VTLILKGFVLKYMEEETDEPADPGHLKNGDSNGGGDRTLRKRVEMGQTLNIAHSLT